MIYISEAHSLPPTRRLAKNGNLLRHYTQNIDCIKRKLPDLEGKTLKLYSQIDQARCQYCVWSTPLVPDWFQTLEFSDYRPYRETLIDRKRKGKRAFRVNELRPNILLYREEHPTGKELEKVKNEDLKAGPEIVFVVETVALEQELPMALSSRALARLRDTVAEQPRCVSSGHAYEHSL